MNMIEVATKEVPFAKRLGYRKRKVVIWPSRRVTVSGVNWSGGTKYEYHVVPLDGSWEVKSFSHWGDKAPWVNTYEGAEIDIPSGFAVVKTGHFCGKPATMYVYMRPDDLPTLLPWVDDSPSSENIYDSPSMQQSIENDRK